MIKDLAHVCFTVRDLDAAVAFYCGKLGLRHAFDFVNDEGARFGVYLHIAGRSFIELFVGQPEASTTPVSYRHLCLEVEDVQEAVKELRGKGVDVTDATLGSDNSWQAWIEDPDGNRIELHSYTAESWQTPHLR